MPNEGLKMLSVNMREHDQAGRNERAVAHAVDLRHARGEWPKPSTTKYSNVVITGGDEALPRECAAHAPSRTSKWPRRRSG